MIAAALPAAGFALSGMVQAIGGLYNIVGEISTWMDKHIQEMQASNIVTVSRTGKVLEGAKYGFGLGYTVPVTVIAVGQFLLGNPLDAAATIVTTGTLTNPLAMTCAAVGAIYYGWNALSDDERADALDKLSRGLEIGIELIKSVIKYVIDGLTSLMTSKHLAEFKKLIADGAKFFGKTLYDVTHDLADKFAQLWLDTSEALMETFEKSKETMIESGDSIYKRVQQAKDSVLVVIDRKNLLPKSDEKK